jgi:hypothetical protein
MDSRFTRRTQIRLSFSHITWKPEKTLRSPSGSLHECSAFTKLEFSCWEWSANLSQEFRQTQRFEGVRFFPNSPTLAPRGSGLTLMIRFHENSWILVKKCNPRNVGVDTHPLDLSQQSYRGSFLKLPPLSPINRELCTVNFFHCFLAFSEVLLTSSQFLRDKGSGVLRLSQFSKVLLSLFFYYPPLSFSVQIREFCFAHFDS